MNFPAAEGTPQIPPAGIAWVGEKKDPAVPTTSPAPAQLRLGPQNRAQQHVIGKDQSHHRAAPIPIRAKLKMLPDLDCKNPRLWLWTLKLVKAPLVLPKQPQVVEAGQGDFHQPPTPPAASSLERKQALPAERIRFREQRRGHFRERQRRKSCTACRKHLSAGN